ncbi:hypothetical protein D0Z07_7533 [Hyphodiscus hymeniophilus]|uniref:Uncharacterized protein n=1 Tax=Hyphodiscus hymeniophilus TaxID=353542 RepID=A0A9P6VEM4_9HELO|nr:hypothetical protein D0Z07_7533 [Hyphodiscus hymeniophilus]
MIMDPATRSSDELGQPRMGDFANQPLYHRLGRWGADKLNNPHTITNHQRRITDLQQRLEDTERQSNEESKKRQELEKQLRYLHQQYRDEISSLHMQFDNSEANMQKQNMDLQKKLEDTQDYVFSLQRREVKITESEATAEFNSLCLSVEAWVETKLGDAIEDRAALSPVLLIPAMRKFLTWITAPGQDAFEYPDTDEFNIIAAIMLFLKMEVFDKDFYCPMGNGERSFLTSIETGMKKLEPRRGLFDL